VFDGGKGEVTGVGVGGGGTPPPPTACQATYSVTSPWSGGFQAQVTVKNPTTSAMNKWTVSWVLANGETVVSAWNGTLTQSRSLATVKSADWNSQLAPGASTSFGFVANQAAAPSPPESISCTSP